MKKLILVCGKARSGKDSAGKMIRNANDYSQVIEMSGGLWEKIGEMFGETPSFIDKNKDNPIIAMGTKTFTPRHFAQYIGNELAPNLLGKFHWCMERQQKMLANPSNVNIITGIRLLKEIDFFTKVNSGSMEIIIIKIVRRNINGTEYCSLGETDQLHQTEKEVDLLEVDHVIEATNLDEIEDELKKLNLI